MDPIGSYHDLTEGFLVLTGMTHPLGHVNAGLAIYLSVQYLLRTRRASIVALHAVLGAELMNEILERFFYGSWRWADTLSDIAVTMFWPTLMYLLSRHRRRRWEKQARAAALLKAQLAAALEPAPVPAPAYLKTR